MQLEGLKEKRVVVTGGSTGIGSATARLLAEQDARVVIGDINEADGRQTVADIAVSGGTAWFVRADVRVEDDCRRLFEEARLHLGGLDALITSGGILRGAFVPLEEFDVETWDLVLDTNTRGSFLCAKYAAPMLRESRGTLVLIASGAGVLGGSASIAYAASKAGVAGLGRVLPQHLPGVRVLTICPGGLRTPMKLHVVEQGVLRSGGTPEEARRAVEAESKTLGDPAGVARVLAFLVSDEGSYVTGGSIITTR